MGLEPHQRKTGLGVHVGPPILWTSKLRLAYCTLPAGAPALRDLPQRSACHHSESTAISTEAALPRTLGRDSIFVMPGHKGAQNEESANLTTALDPSSDALTRLHITPLNPSLLQTYISPAVLPLAANISYHSVATSPEKGFGYVELPKMEAQKLKKKLNGTILKGSKVKIEEARPEKRKVEAADEGEMSVEDARTSKSAKRVKKEKNANGVLPGFELPNDRHVRRSWTDPTTKLKSKKLSKEGKEKKRKAVSSKYTKNPELLFKTNLPPNVASSQTKVSEKSKKARKPKDSRSVIVHEFEKNVKHATFLKTAEASKDHKMTEYVDGKGWVDEEGNVVEEEKVSRKSKRLAEKKSQKSAGKQEPQKTDDAAQDDMSGVESEDNSSAVSSSSSDVSSEASDHPSGASSASETSAVTKPPADSAPPQMEVTPSSPNSTSAPKDEPHPLEAIFKRPKNPGPGPLSLAPINTTFSFLDSLGDVSVDGGGGAVPHTPFTRQDLHVRGIRSAAPTPDTAAIGKKFLFPWADRDEDDEDEDEEDGGDFGLGDDVIQEEDEEEDGNGEDRNGGSASAEDEEMADGAAGDGKGKTKASARKGKGGSEEKEESEFAKWFWEHRGETNRAWKKRRREALKTKRQRENRRLGRKLV